MKTLATISLAIFAVAAFAEGQPNSDLLGRWRLKMDDSARDMSKRLGVPAPTAEFAFLPDRSFTYIARQGSSEIVRKGKFSVDGQVVTLDSPEWPGQATLAQGQLAFNGFNFAKHFEFNAVGEWVLSKNGLVDSAIRASFKKDGSFEFRCANAISRGRYEVDGREILLLWTEVDGDKVAPGSMQKRLTVDEDGSGFKVDQWHYIRKL